MHRKSINLEIERCYRVLELEPGASIEAVKDAWRDLIKVWHPDRFSNDPRLQAKGHVRLKEFNHARKILEEHLADPSSLRRRGWKPAVAQSHANWIRRRPFVASGIGVGLALMLFLGARFSVSSRLSAADLPANPSASSNAEVSADSADDRLMQLVALAPVRVSAHAVGDGEVLLSETEMAGGQTITLPAHRAIYVKYSLGENLQLQIDGTRYTMPTTGADRAKINPPSR